MTQKQEAQMLRNTEVNQSLIAFSRFSVIIWSTAWSIVSSKRSALDNVTYPFWRVKYYFIQFWMTPPIPAHQKAGLYVFKQKADLIYGHVSKCIRIILFIIFLSKHCCRMFICVNKKCYILDVIMNNDGHGQWNETGILLALHQRSFFLLSWLVSITPSWLWCHWGSPSESASPWSAVTNQTVRSH